MKLQSHVGLQYRAYSTHFHQLPQQGTVMTDKLEQLVEIAQAMVAPGKGVLAIDESTGTIKKRFDGVGVESTEANRLDYRSMMLTTPGLGQFISGSHSVR
jgi:hypothetical protein